MESDYQSLFQVRLANYDDIPAIMNITREAFVKYQQMSGVENLAALEESYNDVKKDIDTKVVLLALSDGEIQLHTGSKITSLIRFYYGRGFYIDSTDKSRGYVRALLIKEYQKKDC